MFGVAVASSSAALARRAARACERRGVRVVGVSYVAVDGDPNGHPNLGAALDAAARGDDVAAVLVLAGAVAEPSAFADVCRRAAPHVPIVFVASQPPENDPFFEPWVQALGALHAASLGQAADAVALVQALDPPADAQCTVIGSARETMMATAQRCALAGFRVSQRVDVAFDAALADLETDLVVAVVEEGFPDAAGDALVSARRAHRELPLVVVADGSDAWASDLRAAMLPLGATVVTGDLDLSIGLRLLRRWADVRAHGTAPSRRPRDAARLRGAVRALSAPGASLYAPETQGELIGALGLPYARATRAGYLDDALFAAAEYGYPVRVAAVPSNLAWPDTPRWVVARSSDELLKAGEAELSAAQRALGERVELVVAEALGAATPVSVRVERRADYGVVVTIRSPMGDGHLIAPFDAGDVARSLAPLPPSGPLIEGVHACASECVAAVSHLPPVQALSVELDIGSTGFVTRHAAARLEERP